MPLYEFQCRLCAHTFERRQSVNDPYPECESCGGEVRKVFQPTPIIFKGSGWHITDYGRSGKSHGKDTDSEGKRGDKDFEWDKKSSESEKKAESKV